MAPRSDPPTAGAPRALGEFALPILDQHARPLQSLRLSVTDRCNLRCAYCMPEEEYVWLPRRDLLTYEEFSRAVDAFVLLGVHKVRLTGGEPLLKRDLDVLVRELARKPAIEDLALTTNGVHLAAHARGLREAGLHRLTVSLDTLDPERFAALTRRRDLESVLTGIDAANAAGFAPLKIDAVVMRGVNDDELVPLLEYARSVGAELRYIEYMDVGGATRWTPEKVVSRAEILARLGAACGLPEPVVEASAEARRAPADRFRLPDGTVFGIISSTTQPFCGSCDRSRLTADGHWYTCLYAKEGLPLLPLVRAGLPTGELAERLAAHWRARTDRGAEDRLRVVARGPSAEAKRLKEDPRMEMHTRGG